MCKHWEINTPTTKWRQSASKTFLVCVKYVYVCDYHVTEAKHTSDWAKHEFELVGVEGKEMQKIIQFIYTAPFIQKMQLKMLYNKIKDMK